MTTDHTIEEKLKAIAGIRGRGWQTAAADILGVSTRTLRNAVSGIISDDLRDRIDALYSQLSDADAAATDELTAAGEWAIGRPLIQSDDPNLVGETVVSHLADPPFSMIVRVMRGRSDSGQAVVRTALTPIYGIREGLGELVEQGRRIALREMTATATADAKAREASRRTMERKARHRGWSAIDVATMPIEDLVAAADGMSRAEALEGVTVGQEMMHGADALISAHMDLPAQVRLDLVRAGELRERGRWIRWVSLEAAKSLEHVPGSAQVGRQVKDWSRGRDEDSDPVALSGSKKSVLRDRQFEIGGKAVTRMMESLRDRISEEAIVALDTDVEDAQAAVMMKSHLGADAAALEARQQTVRLVKRAKSLDLPQS